MYRIGAASNSVRGDDANGYVVAAQNLGAGAVRPEHELTGLDLPGLIADLIERDRDVRLCRRDPEGWTADQRLPDADVANDNMVSTA